MTTILLVVLSCRGFSHSLFFVPVHVWNPHLLSGNVHGTDDWSGGHHLLEEDLSFNSG